MVLRGEAFWAEGMRSIKTLPHQDYLKEALTYDPKTGSLTWKQRPETHFVDGTRSAKHQCNLWNARYAGKPAIAATHASTRYLVGEISGIKTLAHRVIWKLVTGEDPLDIDHIDGNGLNNCFSNLRSVSTSDNLKNMKRRVNSKSGFAGVQWFPSTGKWRARIQDHQGREKHIGYFDDLETAINARSLFEIFYGGYLQEKRSA